MYHNSSFIIYKCDECNYETKKKYNLNRHHINKHKYIDSDIINENINEKNVIPRIICNKCNKIYKTKKNLLIHEKKCNGLDDLTCHRCMISFTNRHNKSRHVARNNCKPRSIIYARKPNNNNIENIENIENNYNIETQNNIENHNNNNNITINNYGNERYDYLNYEKMLDIFKKAYDIPSLLTKEIHFNINFPENNNIIKSNKTNCALIKMNEEFIYKNLNNLVLELINDKGILMQKFAIDNKDNICLKMDTQRYEIILELLLKLILLKEPCELYKKQVNNIIDLIRNSNEL